MEKEIVTYLESCDIDKQKFLDQLAHNEKLAELGRLSAGIIHELNTPLSVIVSAVQMILQERDVPEYVTEMVERIGLEARRLSQFTRGVLSFAGNEVEEEGETDVNQVLREVLAFLKYEAQKRSVTVIEALDFTVSPVSAETNRLKQIFINIIMNALQAMGNTGGFLTIQTAATAAGEVSILFADTGPGIPREIAARIFDPFFSTKGSEHGTGLGLFVTRKLVEAVGGTIVVESTPGNGARFIITLPACVTDSP